MNINGYEIKPIGAIRSELANRAAAPRQGDEGAPDAWVEVNPALSQGLEGIAVGSDIILITWFHMAHRDILKLHPRGDRRRPITGVFATRSPDRPNPLGLHRVTVLDLSGHRLTPQLHKKDGNKVQKPYERWSNIVFRP